MPVKKRLYSYKGRLDSKKIADGINAARKNALRLLEDAQELFATSRYPTAAALAILSIEESGKEPILRRLAVSTSDDELTTLWKEYRSHTSKSVMWLLPQLYREGARQLDDFRDLFRLDAEHPYLLDQIKQIGLYTDCLGKAHWSEPSAVIDKALAEALIQIAELFVKEGDVEVKEVELWIKHMGKVRGKNLIDQKEALMRWYAEMIELDLTPKGSKFEDFVKWLGINLNK